MKPSVILGYPPTILSEFPSNDILQTFENLLLLVAELHNIWS